LPQSTELGFQFGFDGLENLGPDFPYLSAVRPPNIRWINLADLSTSGGLSLAIKKLL